MLTGAIKRAFQFLFQKTTGDGEIVARVDSATNVDVWTKVGVMFRDGLAAVFTFGGIIAAGTFGFELSQVIFFAIFFFD